MGMLEKPDMKALVDNLGLKTQVVNALRRNGIHNLEDLVEFSKNMERIQIRNLGTVGKEDIRQLLTGMDLLPTEEVRSLYTCENARASEERQEIYCAMGKPLHDKNRPDRKTIPLKRLQKGEPLELECCQNCPVFRRNGHPLKPEERGWKDGQK